MGLLSSVESWFTGVDVDAEQARSDAADAGNQAIDQQLLEQGTWTQAQYDQAQADTAAGNASTGAGDAAGAIAGEAAVGATEIFTDPAQWWADTKQGADDVAQAAAAAAGRLTANFMDYLKAYASQLLKSIPWWIWVIVALLLAGGLWLIYRKVKQTV